MINAWCKIFLVLTLLACQQTEALSFIHCNKIYFPQKGDVVAPPANIVVSSYRSGPRFTKKDNEYLQSLVILTNKWGDTISLLPTDGGLRPERPLEEGHYTIRIRNSCDESRKVTFSVSKEVPIPKLMAPIDFHWNLKIFDERLGYIYNTCFIYRYCNKYFLTAKFKTAPLVDKQKYVHYRIGFIPKLGPHSKLKPFDGTLLTKSLVQTEGTPEFSHRWGFIELVEKCLGVKVYDGYGQSLGPIYSCRPRKYIKGSNFERTSWKVRYENWEEIEDWVYKD